MEISAEILNHYFLEIEGLANRFDAIPFKIAALLSECARSSSPMAKGSRCSSSSKMKLCTVKLPAAEESTWSP